MKKRFLLIDRDGTLIYEKNYLTDPALLELIPYSADALLKIQTLGWGICLLTNQSAIARGLLDIQRLTAIHDKLERILGGQGVKLDGIYYCPHHPNDGCACRKPLPGMVYQAAADHGFDARECWVIGDKESDIAMARNVGAKSVLVKTGYGYAHHSVTMADMVAEDLSDATNKIIERTNR